MADTQRSLAAIIALCADNATAAISEQDIRDVIETLRPRYGSIYVTTPAATTIASTTPFYKAAGTTASLNLEDWSMPANNRLQYNGAASVHVHAVVSVGFTTASANQVIELRLVRNAGYTDTDAVASTVSRKSGGAGDVGSTAVHFDTMMNTGDYLELWVRNATTPSNVTFQNVYMFVMTMAT